MPERLGSGGKDQLLVDPAAAAPGRERPRWAGRLVDARDLARVTRGLELCSGLVNELVDAQQLLGDLGQLGGQLDIPALDELYPTAVGIHGTSDRGVQRGLALGFLRSAEALTQLMGHQIEFVGAALLLDDLALDGV